MGEVVPLQDPHNPKWVLRRIRELWEKGTVEVTPHAQERLRKWGLDIHDVRHVLRSGRVTEHSQAQRGGWRYRIDGTIVDGGRAACVVEINGNLIVVTVFSLSVRRR
ncbi:MAG: DUF4258 domain-containing protein [Nitrospirota bacterium]